MLKSHAKKAVKRSLNQHVKLAVTGLSKSGKTAFITSLIHQLTRSEPCLPFFSLHQEKRFIAAKCVAQDDLTVPSFDYANGLSQLQSGFWPKSTNQLNTIRLNIKYKPNAGLRARLAETSTLTVDLFDYPGEWLLDLPMLEQDYITWNNQQYALLKTEPRQTYSDEFLSNVGNLLLDSEQNDDTLKQLAYQYRDLLFTFKQQCQLSQLQPGRLIMPGELADAPITLFFPVTPLTEEMVANADENSTLLALKTRFEQYKKEVVQAFYRRFFDGFDRQIILVDLLSALEQGRTALVEQSNVIKSLLTHFDYGQSGIFNRLFSPKIDKILFAANKVDHLSFEHQKDLALLLNNLIYDAKNELNYQGVTVETIAMSSVKATKQVKVQEKGETLNCVYGKSTETDSFITYLPAQPPMRLLSEKQWPQHGFHFPSFYPMLENEELGHIRLDHVLEFLLGDKVQ